MPTLGPRAFDARSRSPAAVRDQAAAQLKPGLPSDASPPCPVAVDKTGHASARRRKKLSLKSWIRFEAGVVLRAGVRGWLSRRRTARDHMPGRLSRPPLSAKLNMALADAAEQTAVPPLPHGCVAASAPKDFASKHSMPRDLAPEDAVRTKEAAPRASVPKDPSPEDLVPKDAALLDPAPKHCGQSLTHGCVAVLIFPIITVCCSGFGMGMPDTCCTGMGMCNVHVHMHVHAHVYLYMCMYKCRFTLRAPTRAH